MTGSSALQILVFILCASAKYFLLGLTFCFLYRCVKHVDFAFGTAFALAPITTVAVAQASGSIALGLAAGACAAPLLLAPVAGTVSWAVTRRSRGEKAERAFIASLGLFIISESAFGLLIGDASVPFVLPGLRGMVMTFPVAISAAQLIITLVSLGGALAFALAIRFTATGLMLRAMQESEATLEEWGAALLPLRLRAYILCYAAAGLAGLLYALDVDPEPRMGMEANLVGVFVALFSRARESRSIAVAAVAIASIEQITSFFLGFNWKIVILFAVIVAVLNLRRRRESVLAVITGGALTRV